MKNNILKLATLILFVAVPAIAQQPAPVTAADYARAEKWMGYNTNPLVYRSGIRPTCHGDERFWYRFTPAEGIEFVMVDAAKGTKAPAFDHAKLAAALLAAGATNIDARRLPFTDFELSADGQTISFSAQRRRWKCDLTAGKCTAEGAAQPQGQGLGGRGGAGNTVLSPDKKRAAFIRDSNLWVRDA